MKIQPISTSGASEPHILNSNIAPSSNLSDEKTSRSSEQENNDKLMNKTDMNREIEGLNKWLKESKTHLKFQLHEKLNEYYVQVINDNTNEVIREVPSKKMMDMVAKMHEMVGLLIDEKR